MQELVEDYFVLGFGNGDFKVVINSTTRWCNVVSYVEDYVLDLTSEEREQPEIILNVVLTPQGLTLEQKQDKDWIQFKKLRIKIPIPFSEANKIWTSYNSREKDQYYIFVTNKNSDDGEIIKVGRNKGSLEELKELEIKAYKNTVFEETKGF